MCKEVIIIGAGGHAQVVADIVECSGDHVFGFLDDSQEKAVLGVIDDCINYKDKLFVIGIGNNEIRKRIFEKYSFLNYYTAIHPTAVVSLKAKIGAGTVVMPNVVINANTTIGEHCIINTSAVVEHDNYIEDFVHVSPNATLCGAVSIGERTHIGAGATVINNVTICDDCTIGAGAVVVKNVETSGVYVGVPVRCCNEGVGAK